MDFQPAGWEPGFHKGEEKGEASPPAPGSWDSGAALARLKRLKYPGHKMGIKET